MGDKDELTLYVNGQQRIKGTQIKVVDVIKKAKECYSLPEALGMCGSITKAWYIVVGKRNDHSVEIDIDREITLFSILIAKEKFGAYGKTNGFWWQLSDRESRLRYFDWLIEQYSKKD